MIDFKQKIKQKLRTEKISTIAVLLAAFSAI